MLRFPSPEARAEALTLYREKATPLHTFRPAATWDDTAEALQRGFSTALQTEFQPGKLTSSEWDLAHQLVEEKYSKLNWRKERVTLISS
jgi:lipoate-protein ligase A